MNRYPSSLPKPSPVFVEALEPRIAPAGLINEAKFTSVVVGGTVLLDASGGANDFQGLSTGFGGNGSYLLYLVTGKALVYTSDLNGNGQFDPGEITGISLGVDSSGRAPSLILFSDVHGDIVTNLLPGHGVSALTDSDNNPNNGRDGRIILPTDIASITIRTITSADLDSTITGDTVANRLGLTSFSIYGNVYCGGNFGGLTIDTSGEGALTTKFNGGTGVELFTGATPQVGSIETGSAVSLQTFHFEQSSGINVEGTFLPFTEPAGTHGGDISNVSAASSATTFSIGSLVTGAGGVGARGGNISNVTLHGDTGSYEVIAGDGGAGATGGQGGSIINFNDLGTVTGEVILHTGAGGAGTLGAGGAGGTATFGTTAIAAEAAVFLGAGGDGFTAGGDGAGQASAVFTAPESTIPIGSKFVGTWHDIGDIGNTHPNADGTYSPEVIDFNAPSFYTVDPAQAPLHNYGDAVFTTSTPGQIVVVFGDGSGALADNNGQFNGSRSESVTLNVPGVVNPVITIGDFNGDGRPDIAVASGDPNNFAGVYVFLDQIGTALDPINSHNYSRNPLGDHPFSNALQSALPTLTSALGVFTGPGAVFALAAGDFNGDGITDLAVVQEATTIVAGIGPTVNVVGILFGEAAHDSTGNVATTTNLATGQIRNAGTGFFYANPRGVGEGSNLQFTYFIAENSAPLLKATSLTSTNGIGTGADHTLAAPEQVFYGIPGDKAITALSTSNFGLSFNNINLPEVDTNRMPATANAPNLTETQTTLQDFAISDLDNDGNADITFLSKTPVQFLAAAAGNGMGAFTAATGDQSGVFLGTGIIAPPIATTLVAIDRTGNGEFNGFALLQFPTMPTPGAVIAEYTIVNPGGSLFAAGATFAAGPTFASGSMDANQTIIGLDAFYVNAPDFSAGTHPHPTAGFGLISPNTSDINGTFLYIFGNSGGGGPTEFRPLTENGFVIVGGHGGGATAGDAGNGGSLGAQTLSAGANDTATGAIQITFPQDATYGGTAYLLAGSGGDGFGAGGAGGNVEGISVRYADNTGVLTSHAFLTAGDGGNGLAGNGGNGGNIDHVSVETGEGFISGNGGSGVNGGAGGNIIGNGAVYDTSTLYVNLLAGNGGQGSALGGAGGGITNWDAIFLDVVGGTGGSLGYVSGAGGSAAAGVGGSGGSITNSSPDSTQNNLSGSLVLQTGAGGNGLTGGDGGAITTFVNQPTNQTAIPTFLSVTTGGGGIGIVNNGGVGGTINGFESNVIGQFSVARIIAGDGGASDGAAGGNGGMVTNATSEATSAAFVIAGGAGGAGLTTGGQGGSVINNTIDSAAQTLGKVLVVAGAGGDASSALPSDIALAGYATPADLLQAQTFLAYGGVTAHAGDGGDISKFSQPVSTQTAVDLIAGNGGSTLNAGTSLDATTGVGHGGSVVDITLAGTVGAVSRNTTLGTTANPPIQAYAAAGDPGATTITAIIDLLANPDSGIFSLSDNAADAGSTGISGNVGIVAGAAGRVRNDQPARDGVNGTAQNISAESIMSIVAGSVSSVAPVSVLSGITVTDPDGVLGVDRTPITVGNPTNSGPNGVLDYFTPAGADVTNLQPGYSLVNGDGALFAITIEQTTATTLAGPRVFQVTNP